MDTEEGCGGPIGAIVAHAGTIESESVRSYARRPRFAPETTQPDHASFGRRARRMARATATERSQRGDNFSSITTTL